MFASFFASLVAGSVLGKGKTMTFLVFILFWTTFVYNVIARWTWNPQGWSYKRHIIDAAGATPVHIASASASLAYTLFYKRFEGMSGSGHTHPRARRYHNMVHVILGTCLVGVRWMGFNGSPVGANMRSVVACISTVLAGSFGGITWFVMDYCARVLKGKPRRFSTLGFRSGVIAGLVGITPAAGYVPPWAAPIIGCAALFGAALATEASQSLEDDMDIFAIHGVGGLVGMLLTGVFASSEIAGLDGYTKIKGGALIDGNWNQISLQLWDAAVGMIISGVASAVFLFILHIISKQSNGHLELFQIDIDDSHEIRDEEFPSDSDNFGNAQQQPNGDIGHGQHTHSAYDSSTEEP